MLLLLNSFQNSIIALLSGKRFDIFLTVLFDSSLHLSNVKTSMCLEQAHTYFEIWKRWVKALKYGGLYLSL